MKKVFIIIFYISIYLCCHAQSPTESQLIEWSNYFLIDETLFVSDTLTGLYHMPNHNIVIPSQFSHNNEFHISPGSVSGDKVLIIADSAIFNHISTHVMRYAEDIHYAYDIGVDVEVCMNGNYFDIKDLILSYSSNLVGCVFIGDIDVAYYEIENDFGKYGYKSWPCDLYYMDIDGQWLDTNNNGIFDVHSGDVKPEIFVGRISSKNMGNLISEISGLISFFNKNHKYWIGQLELNNRTLAYNNKDWSSIPYFSTSIESVFGNNSTDTCNCHSCSDFSKDDYLSKNTSNLYGLIQLSAHSSPFLHNFDCDVSEHLYSQTIFNINNNSIGYNLFCCSACNWKAAGNNGFLGGAYLFNSPSCLFVVGSTKTGSLLAFNNFYSHLGDGDNVGTSFVKWWISTYGNSHSNFIKSWHYGLSILGDPMIMLNNIETCQDSIMLNSYDSSNESNIQIYRASDCINVGDNYQIPVGKKVILDAPNVSLAPSFYCPLGASLEIRNNGCINN